LLEVIRDCVVSSSKCNVNSMNTTKRSIEQEVPEELMIIITNTVVHKGAMMIHSHNTLIAHLAVMSPRRFNFLTWITIPELC